MKYIIIDERMREIEKEKLRSLGYELVEIKKSNRLYPEISSHVDIFTCKINDKIVIEESQYDNIVKQIKNKNIIKGENILKEKYPYDISYNVCIVGKKAIHSFKYTDPKTYNLLLKNNFECIDVKQGYSNCSIAVIDNNSIILSDKGLYNSLKNKDLDVLFLEEKCDIKLLNENGSYSSKTGFIGGAIARLGNNVIVFGELKKIDKQDKIKDFIEQKGIKIIDFKDLDIIDYGGIVAIN